MDIRRTNQDLIILTHSKVRKATWTFNALGQLEFIKIIGAFLLDPDRFNLPDLNMLIPVPTDLYEPVGTGKSRFYQYVYIDQSLRIRDANTGQWRPIQRGYDRNLFTGEQAPHRVGWQWICVMNPTCGPDNTILDLFASIQFFINNHA
jgi:hypothetical protein